MPLLIFVEERFSFPAALRLPEPSRQIDMVVATATVVPRRRRDFSMGQTLGTQNYSHFSRMF